MPAAGHVDATSPCPRDRAGGDDGSTSLELVVLFPAVLLIVFGMVQGALYYHARSVALAAAREGLHSAQAAGGSAAAGRDTARQFFAQAGGRHVMTDAAIDASRGPAQAQITVTGRSITVIPGLPGITVHQTARGAVERYVPAP